MIDTIHISVDNLNEHFIESIREHYPNASLEIKVQEKAKEGLDEQQFWALINLLDWSQDENNEAIIKPLVAKLAARPARHLYDFQDILSEKLYLIDTKKHAENVGENSWNNGEDFFSVDEFLYARCCVVANGEAYFKEVLEDPSKMPKDLTFSALLRVAREAYKLKTGKELRYVPTHNIETFANKNGWKD